MTFKKLSHVILSVIFEYETVKIVSIKSKKVGLICRFIQLLVMTYVIGYVIVYKKGYQNSENGISGLISKVKGVSYTNESDRHVWDVADYVVPPQEDNALFITTNALITKTQTQGKCAEDKHVVGANCKVDSDCVANEPILLGNGVKTGKCLNHSICEIYAWCPVESSKADEAITKRALLNNAYNFTVFVKNSVRFKNFNVIRNNVQAYSNKTKLNTCRYHPQNDPKCPIFTVGTILNLVGTEYEKIAIFGGIISFEINWDCNLDVKIENCFPTYSFSRLDLERSRVSKGWNFRYANYYYKNETQYRDLIKAYGIRFMISVSSKAGRFDIIPLTMNMGSGIALLGIATVLCDFMVIYCLKSRQIYADAKYHLVTGDDAYKPMGSDLESNE